MEFMKWHGAGNDFILVRREALEAEGLTDLSDLSAKICHRRFGIGADGLMVADQSDCADIKMTYYNSDGSYAAMCGNGIRCFSAFCHATGLVEKTEFSVETGDGIKYVSLTCQEGYWVEVDMGTAQTQAEDVPTTLLTKDDQRVSIALEDHLFFMDILKVGVPHAVIDVKSSGVSAKDLAHFGPLIENHEGFPQRTNVNFVEVLGPNHLRVDTWERGAGLTYACGTGVCASAYAYISRGQQQLPVSVDVLGGRLYIDLKEGHIMMKGPAELIANGHWYGVKK